MAPTLGKRKRRDQTDDLGNISGLVRDDTNTNRLQALFRQHFESTFEPLEALASQSRKPKNHETAECLAGSNSDWDGFSVSEDDEDASPALVVQCSTHRSSRADIPKEELKAFMTAKPPSTKSKNASATKMKQPLSTEPDEVDADAANLKKDLALQRLLKESHLLDPQSSLSHTGQNRHKALDLRLQDMGSKSSIFTQQKMPLAQRKGIHAKSAERDDIRRRQAQENGIILEKAVKGKSRASSRRQRGIGAPTIGKLQGGMLKLSKNDVAAIEGPKKSLRGRR